MKGVFVSDTARRLVFLGLPLQNLAPAVLLVLEKKLVGPTIGSELNVPCVTYELLSAEEMLQ